MSNTAVKMSADQVKAALEAIKNPPKRAASEKKAVTFIERFRKAHGLTGMQCWSPAMKGNKLGHVVQFGRGVEVTIDHLTELLGIGYTQDSENPRKFVYQIDREELTPKESTEESSKPEEKKLKGKKK